LLFKYGTTTAAQIQIQLDTQKKIQRYRYSCRQKSSATKKSLKKAIAIAQKPEGIDKGEL